MGEAGDEAHQEAALHCHDQHNDDNEPHANPHPTYDVLDILRLTELREHKILHSEKQPMMDELCDTSMSM